MKRLSDGIKRRIVEHLACHYSHAEVSALIEQEFGVPLTARHVRAYDPLSFQCVASDRLRAYHATVREWLVTEIATIPIANRTFRLRQLQKIYDGAVRAENLTMARETLEQAAKEVGGLYTSTRMAPTLTGRRHREPRVHSGARLH